jgi:hypothetical protein
MCECCKECFVDATVEPIIHKDVKYEGSKLFELEVDIWDGKCCLWFDTDTGCFKIEEAIINFCPMCGEKLRKEDEVL